MKQYNYKIYHKENKNVSELITELNLVKNITILTSIKIEEHMWDNEKINCTTVQITIKENSKFSDLDNKLENMFTNIWFEF